MNSTPRQSEEGLDVTIRSQGAWLTCNNEFILDKMSESVTEESLGDSRGFIESRKQKCVCVIFYGELSSSLFPTSEQKSFDLHSTKSCAQCCGCAKGHA